MKKYFLSYIVVGIGVIILLNAAIFGFALGKGASMEEKREKFISQKEAIKNELIKEGKYRCCLKNPCTYCIEKSPKHGEGATCNCLEDIMAGVHPCGECIGEIMEGNGNPYISEYFARAIAEEVGEQHLDSIKLMISDLYGIPVEEQV